ncbi:MAG: phosphonoacetaldehyde hydrolase [Nitratireductor sp.]|nr:phosphonoacetaldehyde hydrolase [Nitratireductor sp.]MCB1456336.1 phosphonoacetaldehyde hydrolase [Nitratireductor sp.]MCB1457917.1 phosphonoacetaldehyde hydrolase [Nitratireductor sp.]
MDTVARETGFSERAGRRPQPSRKGGRQGNSRFPIIPFYAVLGFLAVSVAATVFGSVTGVGKLEDPFGKPQAIRDIVISGGMDLPIEILDAHSGKTIATYPVGEGGFVRGSLRALTRMRFVAKVDESEPYRLIRWENGAVSLSDTASGERLLLNAFGPDNAAAFAALLDAKDQ